MYNLIDLILDTTLLVLFSLLIYDKTKPFLNNTITNNNEIIETNDEIIETNDEWIEI